MNDRVHFSLSSVGRNVYLQPPTGLFGGDTAWALASYQATQSAYLRSTAYRQTVTTGNGGSQRAALQCWYHVGTAVVQQVSRPTSSGRITASLSWTLTAGLWDTVRLPDQVFAFCDEGRLVHAAVQGSATTDTRVTVGWTAGSTALEVGISVPFLLRRMAPRNVILGPFAVSDGGRVLEVEVDSVGELPIAADHLLFTGRRGAHPLRPCRIDADPLAIKDGVFAVESVEPLRSAGPSLRLRPKSDGTDTWKVVTPSVDVLVRTWDEASVIGAVECDWPYMPTDTGRVWLLVPPDGTAGGPPLTEPSAVWCVYDSTTAPRLSGNRYAVCDDQGTLLWVAEEGTGTVFELPASGDVLVVTPTRGWWCVNNTQYAYTVAWHRSEAEASAERIMHTMATALTMQHLLLLFVRRPDGLYAQPPLSLHSNALDPAVGWTYPPQTWDNTDVFDARGATNGLIGVPERWAPLSGVDWAFLRRRLGARDLEDSRGPEYLRINVDMGSAVLTRAIAWALVTDGCHPTVSLHASNDPAFLGDFAVTVTVDPTVTGHQHTLARAATQLWSIAFTGDGSVWTAADVEAGRADIFLSRIWDAPRHTRLYSDGRVVVAPVEDPFVDVGATPTPGTWRYYALVISVGVTDTSRPYSVELQEFQLMLDTTPARERPVLCLYDRPTLSHGATVYAVRLSRPRG